MPDSSFKSIQSYRSEVFCALPGRRVHTPEEAVRWVNERGFVYFWPITGVVLPSLWVAAAGDRPVADAHDDPGHITWGWKDALLGGRDWYYAKVLRKKATMISFDLLPYFYALSENYGSYEDDYLTLYEQGKLTQEAKTVYEVLLDEGALDTPALRRATHLSGVGSEGRFNRALTNLQADFKILPVRVTQAGAWHYAFAYDVVARHYPELPDQAHEITENQACQRLLEAYLISVGAARVGDIRKLFGWRLVAVERAVERLVKAGVACQGVKFANHPGDWIVLAKLVGSG
ncbi:MAG: crosslink repair DNA glycosylase YcaQ family protein [Chloroflexota bacterium]